MKPIKNLPLSLLLADNDTDDCHFFKQALTGFDLATNIEVVHDGEQLMQLLNAEDGTIPDILFLDLNMPRKNGIECLEEIKSSNELQQIAVVMYSTTSNPSYIEKCYEGGADMYLVKPYGFENLIKALDHVASMDWKHYKTVLSKENFVLNY